MLAKIMAAFAADETAATAVEYGLLAALIAVTIIGGITAVGTKLSSIFSSLATFIGARPTTS